jgi:hypothetical protein
MNWWSCGESNPTTAILQGSPADHSQSHGAWGRFRAHLSASSARRCHQISFPGEVERTARIELASSRWRRDALPLSYVRVVGRDRFERPQHKGGAFTAPWARQCPACPRLVAGRGVAPRSQRLMRPRGSLTDLPAARMADGEGVEPSTLKGLARFSRPVASRDAPPSGNWPSRGGSNTRPHGSEPCALSG